MLPQFHLPEEIAVRVPADLMRATVADIFRTLGMPEADAARSSDVLLYADLRGIDSHGVSNMLRVYVDGLQDGSINPAPQWRVIREGLAVATIDSDRGLGLTVGPQAMAMAIEKAERCGVGTVVVTNGRHFGAAAYHAALALDHDMIGLAMTVGGTRLVPTFGAKAMVGVNPIGVAAPSRREPPFIFDASMSSVAVNKIRIARRLGNRVLPGWIAEADGTPIMEERPVPDDYQMLPLGGTRENGSHKGYSLAVMADILSGVLAGSGPGFLRRAGSSHHFTAYKIAAFTDPAAFKEDMDLYLRGLRETPPAPGQRRVLYAGLPEYEIEIERRERGIPYHPEVIEWLRDLGHTLGIEERLG